MSNDLHQDVKLDLGNLDENALTQGELYAEWSERWAKAYLERDKLKERLTVLRATLDKKIREESSSKPTEAQIAQLITIDEEYQTLSQELIEAQFAVNLYASAKESLDHRRKGLDILMELFKANYFAGKEPYKDLTQKKIKEEQLETLKENPRLVRRT